MGHPFDVLAFGDYCLDLIFSGLPAFPALGREIIGTGFAMLPGGPYNTVAALHRLGVKVGWAADFGNDDFSRFVLERIRAEGVNETLFVHHRRPLRRITAAASYPEDRAFITYYDPEPATPAALKALALSSARAVYLPGLYYGPLFEAGLPLVRAKRMALIMDGNSSEETLDNPAVRKAIQRTDILLPNASEARRLTGRSDLCDALHDLAALGPLVVVKAGAEGAYACTGGELQHVPALPITPMETTGAGDCFNAGFIKAWLEGKSLLDCLRWGNVVGGLSTQALGGTGQVITCAEVERWLKRLP